MRQKLQGTALCALIVGLALMLSPVRVEAQGDTQVQLTGAYPTNYAARPLTLPQWNVRADVAVRVLHLEAGTSTNLVTLGGGFGLGITDNLELGLGTSPIAPIMAAARVVGVHEGLAGVLRPSTRTPVLVSRSEDRPPTATNRTPTPIGAGR